MNCVSFNYILGIFFIILYLIFISLLFFEPLESIMIVCLFILSLLAGFNIITNLISTQGTLNIRIFSEILTDPKNVLSIITSNLTLLIIVIIMIMNIILYTKGASSLGLIISTIAVAIIVALRSGELLGEIPYWLVFVIPIFLTMVSFIIVIVSIINIVMGNNTTIHSLSKISKNLFSFKMFLFLLLSIFILFFIYFFLFFNYDDFDSKINKILQKSVLLISPFLYVLSVYLIYISLSATHVTEENV